MDFARVGRAFVPWCWRAVCAVLERVAQGCVFLRLAVCGPLGAAAGAGQGLVAAACQGVSATFCFLGDRSIVCDRLAPKAMGASIPTLWSGRSTPVTMSNQWSSSLLVHHCVSSLVRCAWLKQYSQGLSGL